MTAASLTRTLPIAAPLVGLVALGATWGSTPRGATVAIVAVILAAAVISAVHHAEVIAHRVGEPFGSLILAVAVTIIEVGLIITLMTSGGSEAATLARDTVFAAVMITVNGIIGLSLLVRTRGGQIARFNAEGSGTALATVATLATLTLVLPTFTTSTPGPEFSGTQLAFAAISSLALYGSFVLVQTVRHRDYFLPVGKVGDDDHADPPTTNAAFASAALLLAALVSVVGLAKVESKPIEDAVMNAGLPQSAVGVIIALLVLAPESIAAVRAASHGRTQTSLNLALGSAIASIGLTIPAIALASNWLDGPLELGLGPTQMVLLVISMLVGALTIVPGRATLQQAMVHLTLFAAFLVLAVNP
jgi:Ca2+:H+ antiporter